MKCSIYEYLCGIGTACKRTLFALFGFFFSSRRRHTRFDCDWSSDVCSSDLFSAIDAILLRPLPFPEGDQLMRLEQFRRKVKNPMGRLAPVRLEDWNRMNSTFPERKSGGEGKRVELGGGRII